MRASEKTMIARAILLAVLPVASLAAQKLFIGTTGAVFRYHGDTVWMERDSTLIRSIRRGDTIFERRMINDRLVRETVGLVPNATGDVTISNGADGDERVTSPGLTGELHAVSPTRAIFALEVHNQEIRDRWPMPSQHEPPISPETPREYVLSSSARLVQHRDTIRLISGCPREHNDTTTFLMFGGDSTWRLSSPSRSFGMGMAQSLIGQMRRVLLEAELRADSNVPPNVVVTVVDTCR